MKNVKAFLFSMIMIMNSLEIITSEKHKKDDDFKFVEENISRTSNAISYRSYLCCVLSKQESLLLNTRGICCQEARIDIKMKVVDQYAYALRRIGYKDEADQITNFKSTTEFLQAVWPICCCLSSMNSDMPTNQYIKRSQAIMHNIILDSKDCDCSDDDYLKAYIQPSIRPCDCNEGGY